MILCNVDESGRVLTMSYNHRVGAEDMRACLGTVRDLMEQLKPGFFLLTDLTHLETMEASCAPDLGAIMELCSAKGMSTVVRVISFLNFTFSCRLRRRRTKASPTP
jgi:hypothetical protein